MPTIEPVAVSESDDEAVIVLDRLMFLASEFNDNVGAEKFPSDVSVMSAEEEILSEEATTLPKLIVPAACEPPFAVRTTLASELVIVLSGSTRFPPRAL